MIGMGENPAGRMTRMEIPDELATTIAVNIERMITDPREFEKLTRPPKNPFKVDKETLIAAQIFMVVKGCAESYEEHMAGLDKEPDTRKAFDQTVRSFHNAFGMAKTRMEAEKHEPLDL
jgi:hypothetical protein